MSIDESVFIPFRRHIDGRGTLTFVEGARDIPFSVARVYYVFHVPGHGVRARHAHRHLEQVVVAIAGRFELELDDGIRKRNLVLSDPCVGLYIPPMLWREYRNFSVDGICLVLASQAYQEEDYIRSYHEFLGSAEVWTRRADWARNHQVL